MLDTIGLKIAQLISEDIKVDAGNPLNEERNIQVVEEAAMQAKEEKNLRFKSVVAYCLVHIKTVKTVTPIWTDSLCFTKMKYVVIYMNEENIESNMEKINQLHFVRSVDKSYRPDVEMNFAEKIGTKAAYQEQEDDGYVVEELSTEIRLAENV